MSITQTEFSRLLSLEKTFDAADTLILGPPPASWSRGLTAPSTRDKFILDFRRSGFEITKYSYNKRYRQTIIMVRYCSTVRHTNPDGVTFDGPHVHLFREGFDDKFAFPVSEMGVDSGDAMDIVLIKLLRYCNVSGIPVIELGLF
jgi:hypothetical protein